MAVYGMKTLQPHTGAIIMALYHHKKFPTMLNFDIRMVSPFNKVYRVTIEGQTRDELIFRTGKDWPCYSRVYFHSNETEFRVNHSHSFVKEEFRIERNRLYMGDVRTEAGIRVEFEGDFLNPTKLEVIENFRTFEGHPHFGRSEYEVERAW